MVQGRGLSMYHQTLSTEKEGSRPTASCKGMTQLHMIPVIGQHSGTRPHITARDAGKYVPELSQLNLRRSGEAEKDRQWIIGDDEQFWHKLE